MITAAVAVNVKAEDKPGLQLEQVIVTAQKSKEDLQDVPMTIDVFDEFKLDDYSVSNLEDLAKYVPNLHLFNTGEQGWVTPSIRGATANMSTFTTPVSIYIDGVPVMNVSGFNDTLLDIERVEVLKGPQGTLYGKNSEAGVINIITRKPDNEFRGKIYNTTGTDGKLEYGFNLSGPIIKDKFYAGISFKHDEKDGFIKHYLTNEEVNFKETNSGKLNLRFTPTDALDISFIASRYEQDDGAKDWAPAGQGDNPVLTTDLNNTTTPEIDSYSLSIDYALSANTRFKSVTTKRTNHDRSVVDSDMGMRPMEHYYRNYKFENISQEIRLEQNIWNTKLIAGAYYSENEDDLTLNVRTIWDPTGFFPGPQYIDTKTHSVFLNATHPLNDKWTINGGIRYDEEEKDFNFVNANLKLNDKWSNISPKLSLQYAINEDSMVYTTVAKGYMSGGFNPYRGHMGTPSYDDESLVSYEIGYKSLHFNKRLRVNTAAYLMDFSNMQVQRLPTPLISYMENAAEATSKGVELDLEALITDEITVSLAVGINITKFDEYKDPFTDINYEGNYNLYTPKYNFNLGVQYRGKSGFYGRVDLNGKGETYYDIENTRSKDAYMTVNTKVGYEAGSFDIYAYAENLFDENLDEENAYFFGSTTIYREEREIGVKLAYRF